MAKTLNYTQIPAAKRRRTASAALAQLKASLGNPALSLDQHTAVLTKIEKITQWAAGTLSTNHDVVIEEDIVVIES